MSLEILFESGAKMTMPIRRGFERALSVSKTRDGKVIDIKYEDGDSAIMYVDYSKVVCVCLVKD